jgi:hypothetical protein
MLKKIIASRPNKKDGRPPLNPRTRLPDKKVSGSCAKDGNMASKREFALFLKQKENYQNQRLQDMIKRLQAESTIADKDAALADKDAALSAKAALVLEEQSKRGVAEAKAAKLAAKLRALGIDPEDV